MSYLNDMPTLMGKKGDFKTAKDFQDLNKLDEALAVRTVHQCVDVMMRYASDPANDLDKMNLTFGSEIVDMTRSHLLYLSFKMFKEGIESLNVTCTKIQPLLR